MLDGPGSRSYFEDLLDEIGISPRISYISTSLESVRSAVAAGFGFTLLVMRPPSPITYDGGRVKTLQIDNDVRPLRIVLASRDGAHRGLILATLHGPCRRVFRVPPRYAGIVHMAFVARASVPVVRSYPRSPAAADGRACGAFLKARESKCGPNADAARLRKLVAAVCQRCARCDDYPRWR